MSDWPKRTLVVIGKYVYLVAAIGAVLWIATYVYGLNTKVFVYAKIGTPQRSLGVAGSSSLGSRYAIVQVNDGDAASNVVLEPKEWDELLAMWQKAKAEQSPNWHEIGAITESDVFNPSRLTLSGGRGARFAIIDDGACLRYDLAPADFAKFEAALNRAKRHYTDDSVDTGETGAVSRSPDWKSAAETTNQAFKSSLPRGLKDCR